MTVDIPKLYGVTHGLGPKRDLTLPVSDGRCRAAAGPSRCATLVERVHRILADGHEGILGRHLCVSPGFAVSQRKLELTVLPYTKAPAALHMATTAASTPGRCPAYSAEPCWVGISAVSEHELPA